MEEEIIKYVTELPFNELMISVVIFFVLYLVYLKMTGTAEFVEITQVERTKQAELWEYIHGELSIIEAQVLGRASKIINEAEVEDCNRACKMSSRETMYMTFSVALERSLFDTIFGRLKTMMRVNGFHSKTGAELDAYIDDKGEVLLNISRKQIRTRIGHLKVLRTSENDRFTSKESKDMVRKIVTKAIAIRKETIIETKKIKDKYSLWQKINFVGKLIGRLKTPAKPQE